MARHLEFVFGPLGEETRLACVCPRESNHLRPNSSSRRIADEFEAPVVTALPPRSERVRARSRAQHRAADRTHDRLRAAFAQPARARRAA